MLLTAENRMIAVGNEFAAKHVNTLCGQNVDFVGAFAKLRKGTISFVMSIRPFVCPSAWNNSAPAGRIFMKFGI
jgi:hypothetical protein